MYVNDIGFEPSQSFAYEIKGDSAVILRCFSRDTRAEVPELLDGYPVTELGPYAFSAHMDEEAFQKGICGGKIKIFIPEMMGTKEVEKAGAAAASAETDRKVICVPDAPVLAGNALEEILIPHTVRRIGRYCFYNCTKLTRIVFRSVLQDLGAGVFTGVHHIKELTVTADPDGKTILKQILDELHEEITVTYFDEKGNEARLVFPEFFEEGVENTPAKLHEVRIHGSGMMYRNCITQRRMDFRQYDSLFEHAGFLESKNMTARLALARLQYPVELTEKAQEQYETYIIKNAEEAADQFLKERNLDGIRWLLELYDKIAERKSVDADHMGCMESDGLFQKDSLKQRQSVLQSYIMEMAARQQFTEATSFLMNFGHKAKRAVRKRFEL